ncbi:MAG TPA: OmpH family outer membrane protein [Chitinophagales bacterium]|nr:OmpH family outer membrane protein [Chitinophagales bacterium]
MKRTLAIVFTALTAFFGTANAQQKIGHINSLDVLQAMPEFKQMSADIDKQKESYQKALENMYADYQKKQTELQDLTKDNKAPDAIVESKIQELQDLQKRIQDFESKANDDIQKMQQDKLKPIQDKYTKAVKEVAQANGYAYVLDVNSGAVAYFPENTDDLTDLVMKKLGVTPAPAGTGSTAPKSTAPGAK